MKAQISIAIKSIALALTAVVLVSCEETIELDAKQTAPQIVIEGQVTSKPSYQYVKVSRTSPFYVSGNTPRVTDAVVSISDDTGAEYPFIHNPRNHPDSAGIYLPLDANFVGSVGRTYTLHVQTDETLFEAADPMLSVASIDSVGFKVNEFQEEDPNEPGKIYEMLLYTREPPDEKNYYLFRYYRNDSLVLYTPTDIYYSNDELFGEIIDGLASPVYFGEGDIARLEIYSLTRRGYVFYNDLYSVLNNDAGGMFGPIPAAPRSNISNGALGFFQVSAIREAETLIE